MEILTRLESTIRARKSADAGKSYVASLFAKGKKVIAGKFEEESDELIEAAAKGERSQIVYEAADTLFHLMVLLAAHEVTIDEVLAELKRREGVSGIEEKNRRKKNPC